MQPIDDRVGGMSPQSDEAQSREEQPPALVQHRRECKASASIGGLRVAIAQITEPAGHAEPVFSRNGTLVEAAFGTAGRLGGQQ